MNLCIATHGRERHFVVVKRTIEVCVCRDCRCGFGLAELIKGDFRLGKEFVPKVEREIIGDSSKYAEKM